MNKFNQDYYKIWKSDFYTIEANIDRSLWENKFIKSFEKRLNKIISVIFENSKNTLLVNNILISLLFTGDKKVAELNNYYRKIHKSTNVLSFPSKEINNSNEMLLGDIVFSSQTIVDEARKDNKNLDDHLIHLFIHGVLHLLGYEHETEDDAYIMESLEIKVLNNLNIDNPYK